MAMARSQARPAPEPERCAALHLFPQERADNDVPATQPGQGETLVGYVQMLRDSGIGLVEQFRAAKGGEDAARIWHLAIDTCVAMLESDDSRVFNRGVQFCLGLAREQTSTGRA